MASLYPRAGPKARSRCLGPIPGLHRPPGPLGEVLRHPGPVQHEEDAAGVRRAGSGEDGNGGNPGADGSEEPRPQGGASINLKQLQLFAMSLLSMVSNISLSQIRGAFVPHRPNKIPILPKLSPPELLLNLRIFLKYLTRRNTLQHPHHPGDQQASLPVRDFPWKPRKTSISLWVLNRRTNTYRRYQNLGENEFRDPFLNLVDRYQREADEEKRYLTRRKIAELNRRILQCQNVCVG